MRLTVSAILISIVLLVTLAPRAAVADDASEARLQYELGSEFYRQKRFAEAMDRFIASNRLVPNPNVVYNIANICVLLGKREAKSDRERSTQWYVEAFNWATALTDLAVSESDRKDAEVLRTLILPKVAVLTVRSDPAGAELFIDREALGSVGRTPRDVATTPGDHAIIVKLAGYRSAPTHTAAKLGTVVSLQVPLELIAGTLQVTARPTGVRLQYFPGGLDLGAAPATVKLPVGGGRLTLIAAGFVTQTRELVIREGETTTLDVELQKAADHAASLTVAGQPNGAVVRLAGREVGRVPLTLSGLEPGPQSLELAASAYNPWKGELLLEAGTATRVDAVLRRPDDRPWRGWKWLGYGAGAALLGAGGVVALQARSARDQFLAEPSNSNRDRVDRLNPRADVLLGAGLVALAGTALVQWLLSGRYDSHAAVHTHR